MGVRTEVGLCFAFGFLADMARLLQCLHHREPFEKWWPDRLLYATIFRRVLVIIRIKIRHLKSEKKTGIQMDRTLVYIELLKATNYLFQERI